jgi:quinoprotein glucose dehydrogenase
MMMAACKKSGTAYETWQVTGGSSEGIRYSSATQIDTSNVNQLEVAWTYHTGDADTVNHSQMQCNPIIVDNVLYGTSPQLKLIAVDAVTGKERWTFDPQRPQSENRKLDFILNNNRGVTYWSNGTEKRIFYSVGSSLLCVDAGTGTLIKSFGNSGSVDLRKGLDRDVDDLYIASTSPGVIYKNLIIMGTRVSENSDAAPGHIRAYDVMSGELKWIFHTIPQPGEFGYDTWDDPEAWKHIGGANDWSGFTLDQHRGILYAPIGSASFDFYGGRRTGDNLFADCLLAIDAATGKRIWHFQNIHHDIWDKDLPTPPALVTVVHDGKKIDAVAQPTKTGFVFLLDRETGESLFPIQETPVRTDTELEGEKLSPTQPIPVLPEPFARQVFDPARLNPYLSDSSRAELAARIKTYRNGTLFEPMSRQGTILFPGLDGGAEWGGPAFDPDTKLLYINANETPGLITMADVPTTKSNKATTNLDAGVQLYQKNCVACHGVNLEGGGNYPSLKNLKGRYDLTSVKELVSSGRRMMPAFKHLSDADKGAIASYILHLKDLQSKPFQGATVTTDRYRDLPYTITGYHKLESKEGLPAIAPPWGTLSAINLNTGKIQWQIPLGTDPRFSPKGVNTGSENYGGPAVTAGGILFIAATPDRKFRAFNKRTGQLLWETELPAAAFATPAVYVINGKQYVVVVCGGGKLGTKSGDSYVAFAIP